MPRCFRWASFLIAACVLTDTTHGADCSRAQASLEKLSASVVDTPSTQDHWPSFLKWFKAYADCDDGGLAEQISVHIVNAAMRDTQSPEFLKAINKNLPFREFVLKHIDETASADSLKNIRQQGNDCRSQDLKICREIVDRANAALSQVQTSQQKAEDWKVGSEPLEARGRVVTGNPILKEPIRFLARSGDVVVAASQRNAWILKGKKVQKLRPSPSWPKEADWVSTVCASTRTVYLALASYPESQKQSEEATLEGGFRKGPKPLNVFRLDLRQGTLKPVLQDADEAGREIDSCAVVADWVYTAGPYGVYHIDAAVGRSIHTSYPTEIATYKSSVVFDPNGSGILVTEEDDELHRSSLIWEGETVQRFFPLNASDNKPDRIVSWDGRWFLSTATGLVEWKPSDRTYVHYPMSPEGQTRAVYQASVIDRELWATRDDGWLLFDLPKRQVIHYTFKNAPNKIYALQVKGNTLWVATETVLYQAHR